MAKLIDGKAIAGNLRENIKKEVDELLKAGKRAPGLAVIIVGDRKDSHTYVRMKKRAAAEVGIQSFSTELPASISQEELMKAVQKYNEDPVVDGILVQLPLPDHIDEKSVLDSVKLEKDVDGFHPVNVGLLCMKGRTPTSVACTPQGCMELLDQTGVKVEGKHAVVLGRSNIVGLPVSMLLLQRNATVTICHSATPNLAEEIKRADILIAACGRAQIVKKDWVKPGAVVLDVGMNAIDNGAGGTKLVGDVDFDNVKDVASAITPVPGGVGPMTIACLLRNTLEIAKRAQNKSEN